MTATAEPVPSTTARIDDKAVDALINSTLSHIDRDDKDSPLLPWSTADDAYEALFEYLGRVAPQWRQSILVNNGFRLGMKFAAMHTSDPFGDHREAVRALIDVAIANEVDGQA